MLVVSKPSPNNLFPGYGIVKVKLNISLQKYCHVSLKFVGLQYLHIKVCFVTYFTELCWCLVQLNLKTWFPYDRPDHPSRLKKCSDDRDDHMETLPRRLQMTRTTETTLIAWIELSSIRMIGTIM